MNEQSDIDRPLNSSGVELARRQNVSASEYAPDLHRPSGWIGELWNIGRAFVFLAAIMVLIVGGVRPDKDYLSSVAVTVLCLGLLLLLDRSRYYLMWSAYVVGIVVFAHIRVFADDTAIPTQYTYVIDLERLLFAGHVPSFWLQQRLYEFEQLTALNLYLIIIYLSYFVVPYVVAAALWTWRRAQFAAYVAGTLGTFYLGLLIYFLVPTSPPWLAAEEGYLPHVFRVVRDILYDTNPIMYRAGHEAVGKNDVAAMPSLHFAVTLLILLVLWRYGRVFRALGIIYTISMGVALVYLGEHYVIDLIAGAGVASLVWWTVSQWTSPEITSTSRSNAEFAPASSGDK